MRCVVMDARVVEGVACDGCRSKKESVMAQGGGQSSSSAGELCT